MDLTSILSHPLFSALLGALAGALAARAPVVAAFLRWVASALPARPPAPDAPAPATPDDPPATGRPVLDAVLRLLHRARTRPEALTAQEREDASLVWHATPDEDPAAPAAR